MKTVREGLARLNGILKRSTAYLPHLLIVITVMRLSPLFGVATTPPEFTEAYIQESVQIMKVTQMFPWSKTIIIDYRLLKNDTLASTEGTYSSITKKLIFRIGDVASSTIVLGIYNGSHFTPSISAGDYRAYVTLPDGFDCTMLEVTIAISATFEEPGPY